MRKDMRHVLIDRPRAGSGAPNRKERVKHKNNIENLPSHGSKHLTERSKSLSDHIQPLRRFLEKQVGRPWDKVYSEICENLDKRSTLQAHVFEHIFQYVNRYVEIRDDGIWEKPNDRYRGYHKLNPGDMYVHPKTGILKKIPGNYMSWWKRSRTQLKKDPLSFVKDGRAFARCNGIWYELSYILYVQKNIWVWKEDISTENVRYIGHPDYGYYRVSYVEYKTERDLGEYPRQIYPDFDGTAPSVGKGFSIQAAWVARKQLNSDQLRKHGLKNSH